MKFLSRIKTKPRLIGSYLIVSFLIVLVAVVRSDGDEINK